jgi:SAM-dependent methyltransferase
MLSVKKIFYFLQYKTSLFDFLRLRLDTEDFSNDRFARCVAAEIPSDSRVLDAGAGRRPYAHYHTSHHYISTDYGGERTVNKTDRHDFFSDITSIPLQSKVFDAIICYQVLEHVPEPEQVLRELYRTLRPGGWLFLTVPQGWGLHHEPYHYFNFTRYGLLWLFDRVGFTDVRIEERGGIFWLLAQRLKMLPYYILFQYIYPLIKPKRAATLHLDTSRWHNLAWVALLLPFYLLSLPFLWLFIPLLFFYIDKLDRRRLYCLGYQCRCRKPLETI